MPFLSDTDRKSLLRLARLAITEAVTYARILADIPAAGLFSEQRGVFVSLHVRKRLRGCIGVVDPELPLGESIVRCAISAATRDPRFPAMRPDELDQLEIEISLLSAPRPIRPEQIQIGTHGLLICRGAYRGVLLPQVAVAHQLNAEQFLAEICRKAELPPDTWRDPEAKLFGFTSEVFSSNTQSDE